ncbi:hypothetical protein CC2G_009969 [Coprinopsis cinerea AmutBmut pab1-1]|nr:hypothetical protein CC2G_009969 [Coprinopsis cinerea AmutBmut pab1-1]
MEVFEEGCDTEARTGEGEMSKPGKWHGWSSSNVRRHNNICFVGKRSEKSQLQMNQAWHPGQRLDHLFFGWKGIASRTMECVHFDVKFGEVHEIGYGARKERETSLANELP